MSDNIYIQSLRWLTPKTPFRPNPDPDPEAPTVISYAFSGQRNYAVNDPESDGTSIDALTWTSSERAAAVSALTAWTSVANIDLHEVVGDEKPTVNLLKTSEAEMREYFGGERGVLGFSTLPFDYGPALGLGVTEGYTPGISVFNKDGFGWTSNNPGGYGYATLVHEIGHLLGLDHPFNEGGIGEPSFPGSGPFKTGEFGLNQGIFTAMSYNDGWTGQPSKNVAWGYQMGPGAFDIAAIQEIYGANWSHNSGNTQYSLKTVNAAGTGWQCIWDGAGDHDIIQVGAATTAACTIDLRDAPLTGPNAGGFVSWVKGIAGGFTIANGADIEDATGGGGADTITGNDLANILKGLAGNDTLRGLEGDDMLVAGLGKDTLWGGVGDDEFVFEVILDSGAGAKQRDAIMDFEHLHDDIDLRGIDADNTANGNQDFTFLGSGAFARHPGELRYSGGVLAGDVNGDTRADFEIAITVLNNAQLTKDDFLGILVA